MITAGRDLVVACPALQAAESYSTQAYLPRGIGALFQGTQQLPRGRLALSTYPPYLQDLAVAVIVYDRVSSSGNMFPGFCADHQGNI